MPRIGCSYLIMTLGFVVLGILFIVSGFQLRPQDDEAAQVFRTDPSCTATLSAVVRPGACTIVNATILVAAERRGGGMSRTPSYTPYVYVRLADGTTQHDDLDGGAGSVFVDFVHSGAPARAQLFRGTLVRVVSGDNSSETISAPDVSLTDDSEMPWVGGGLIVIGALFFYAGLRAGRRAAHPA